MAQAAAMAHASLMSGRSAEGHVAPRLLVTPTRSTAINVSTNDDR
jgi:hypothetical protein